METLSKLEAADRQYDYAVEAFFRGHDKVVVHSLFCAANNIFGDLAEKNGDSWREHLANDNQKSVAQIVSAINHAWNFFKHANGSHPQSLTLDSIDTEHIAFVATLERGNLGGLTIPMQVFQIWYMAKHSAAPNQQIANQVELRLPGLRDQNQQSQLERGLELLLSAKA